MESRIIHPIPEDVRRLADRLRDLADEVESAARWGVPVPIHWYVSGHHFGSVGCSTDPYEFAAWAEYVEADVTESIHHGGVWRSFVADVNGLPVKLSCRVSDAPVDEATA